MIKTHICIEEGDKLGKKLDLLKNAGGKAKQASDKAKQAKKGYDKAKQVGHDAYDEGLDRVAIDETKNLGKKKAKNTLNKALSKPKSLAKNGVKSLLKNPKQASKAAAKAAVEGIKALMVWLATPVLGWVVSLILVITLFSVLSNTDSDSTLLAGEGNGFNDLTTEEYAALQNGCPPNLLSGGPSGSVQLGEGQTEFSLDEVTTFMSSSTMSTWGVPLDDAEALFLSRNSRVALYYGVTASNIREISNAIQAEGVSPVFLWLYAVEEGGGFGGYINHFTQSNASSDRVEAGRNDARKILEESKNPNGYIASGGGIVTYMPLEPAIEILDRMPSGSIGRAYLKMTAAVTAEIVTLNGHPGDWSPGQNQAQFGGVGTYGPPVSKMMTLIQQLGGDPFSDAQMTNMQVSNDCSESNNSQGLVSGGMNLEEARAFMYTYYEADLSANDVLPALPGPQFIKDNCTAFVAYFLKNYTSIQSKGGDGGDIVENLLGGYSDLARSDTPTVYGVFSVRNQEGLTSSSAGHTGIILGIDTDRGKVVVGQANWGLPFRGMDAPSSGVNAMEYDLDFFEGDNWSFADISAHLTMDQ